MRHQLSAQRIAAFCLPVAQHIAIEAVAETGSTNADLLARIDRLRTATFLVAETQTAGRGRAGRSWLSAPDASLTFSLAWKFNRPILALGGLPLAIGVALAESLAEYDVKVQLKWPNDLLKDGDKLAGILIETAAAQNTGASADTNVNAIAHPSSTNTWAVIGVGLNVSLPVELAAQIERPAASASALARLDRDQLIAHLLNGMAAALLEFEQQGFQAFVTRWNTLHAYVGKAVTIVDRGQVLHEGIALGVDAQGRLLLDTATGSATVLAGDVSLRVQA